MEAADVVLVRSELSKLAAYIQLSKDTSRAPPWTRGALFCMALVPIRLVLCVS